jgi:hypothetical protein
LPLPLPTLNGYTAGPGRNLVRELTSPTVMALLSLAAGDIRTAAAIVALPPTRPPAAMHTALALADALRATFGAV